MKNIVKTTATKGVNNTAVTAKEAIRPALLANTNVLSPNTTFDQVKEEQIKTEDLGFVTQNAPAIVVIEPTQEAELLTGSTSEEPTKKEIKEQLQQKPVFGLENTIKLALDLNRRISHRAKLLETITILEAFEIAQKDDAEETNTNHYQGCALTIEDDKGREFTTKNPFIIMAVAGMVNTLCIDKLAEIESGIVIPV